jgi:hypothetical protein
MLAAIGCQQGERNQARTIHHKLARENRRSSKLL